MARYFGNDAERDAPVSRVRRGR